MARINLSIPDGMKQQMDEISGVSWSSVAAVAFEKFITQHKTRGDSMSEVKERLLASKARYEAEMIETGESYGRDWGKNEAEYEQLLSLQKSEEYPESFRELFGLVADDPNDGYEYEGFLASVFGHEWRGDVEKYDNPQFCEGFVKGAVELFKEAMAA